MSDWSRAKDWAGGECSPACSALAERARSSPKLHENAQSKVGDLIGHTVLGRLQPLAAAGIVPGREWTELGDGTIDPFQGIRACGTVPVKIPGR